MSEDSDILQSTTPLEKRPLRGRLSHSGIFALFLVATVAIFVLWQTRPVTYLHGEPVNVISVEGSVAEDLRAIPNSVYENALIASIAEEIYVRDGVAMGLVTTDTIIRQRIIQQQRLAMMPEAPEISDDDLRAWFASHREQFRVPTVYTFEQRFFRRDNDDELDQAVEQIIDAQTLNAEIGDPFVHGTAFGAQSEQQISTLFGDDFARAIESAPLGKWFGPVDSNFGNHVIRVNGLTETHVASYDDVRDDVYAMWASIEREQTLRNRLSKIRSTYAIVVPEGPVRAD